MWTKVSLMDISDRMMINKLLSWSRDGSFIILFFEGFYMFDIGDVVLDFSEGRKGLCWDGVSEILFNLHGEFNGVQGIESMLFERAIFGDTWFSRKVPFLKVVLK